MDWRIYYADGSTFDSSQGEPKDAPGFRVVCIAMRNESVGRVICCKWYAYYWNPEERAWSGTDLFSMLIRRAMRLPTEAESFGEMLSNEHFNEIMDRAANDPDFPVRTGFLPRGDPRGERMIEL